MSHVYGNQTNTLPYTHQSSNEHMDIYIYIYIKAGFITIDVKDEEAYSQIGFPLQSIFAFSHVTNTS